MTALTDAQMRATDYTELSQQLLRLADLTDYGDDDRAMRQAARLLDRLAKADARVVKLETFAQSIAARDDSLGDDARAALATPDVGEA